MVYRPYAAGTRISLRRLRAAIPPQEDLQESGLLCKITPICDGLLPLIGVLTAWGALLIVALTV